MKWSLFNRQTKGGKVGIPAFIGTALVAVITMTALLTACPATSDSSDSGGGGLSAPVNLMAYPGPVVGNEFTQFVTWTPPANNSGYEILNYRIYYSQTQGFSRVDGFEFSTDFTNAFPYDGPNKSTAARIQLSEAGTYYYVVQAIYSNRAKPTSLEYSFEVETSPTDVQLVAFMKALLAKGIEAWGTVVTDNSTVYTPLLTNGAYLGISDMTVVWSSDPSGTLDVNPNDGTVTLTRPDTDTSVKVTATITLNEATDSLVTTYSVKAKPKDAAAEVAAAKAALAIPLGANINANNIKDVLGTLPSTGLEGTTITWKSSDTVVLSDDGQTIFRGAFDQTITMTATITSTDTAVSDTKEFILIVKASQLEINSFSIDLEGITYNGQIDSIPDIGEVIIGPVPYGTDLTAVPVTFDIGGVNEAVVAGETLTSGTSTIDFSKGKVTFIVQNIGGGKTRTYTISAYAMPANTGTQILTFSVAGVQGSIDYTAGTIAITVPKGTDPTQLAPTYTLSTGATVKVGTTDQESGTTVNDFTNPVEYVVTSQDGMKTMTYTVTVSVSTEFEITGITLSETSVTATVGTEITPITPTLAPSGAMATEYSITPDISNGLTFDSATGTISGTPTAEAELVTYTIAVVTPDTGYSLPTTEVSATVDITVNLVEIMSLTMSETSITATVGTAITPITPTLAPSGATATEYSITPDIGYGLSFDSTTGTISGTPTAEAELITYTIAVVTPGTGYSLPTTEVSATVGITVISIEITGLTLSETSVTATVGTEITPITPTLTPSGATATSYSIDVNITSTGLSFDTATGIISGTPLYSLGKITYTISVETPGEGYSLPAGGISASVEIDFIAATAR